MRFIKMIVAIVMRTCQRDEQGAGTHPARIDFNSGKFGILAETVSAGPFGDIG
ncbi:MAG: hypothetical protein Q7U66_17380 [Methylobacter sp.]|nr:hypothetical protein [Methylobacter sp.]